MAAPYTSELAETLAADVLDRFLRYVRVDTQSARGRSGRGRSHIQRRRSCAHDRRRRDRHGGDRPRRRSGGDLTELVRARRPAFVRTN